ncbi:MarR family winged helix-turn-helix transcriptional regulator [Rhodococcus qingshengii]|uniref:MarR family winged helix-turn-helix transcriptional regulator n=1 Tax=Rhodococcus qingshengii TaxID=334542 RepID=UPI0022B42599|nr:MarR family transcriptional regulator [Rhodococcus qingshengii]MCZ4618313.1 MarR family transcriptional regulator [Rhodococcus qingshengii]
MSAVREHGVDAENHFTEQVDAVLWASRALVGIAAASVAEAEELVTVPHLRILVLVDTRGPVNLAAVAAALAVHPSNASRAVDRLIKAGLLDRRDALDDRRHLTLTLTPAGQELVDRVSAHRREAISAVLARMTSDDRNALAYTMRRFAAAAGEPIDGDILTLLWPPAH